MLWGRLPALKRADDAPFLADEFACRAATQSTHQASWRDYNAVADKESPHSYGWRADGPAKHTGFTGFMINSHRSQRGAMYTRGEFVTSGARLGLRLLRSLLRRQPPWGP